MESKIIVIQGSSRSKGDTFKVIQFLGTKIAFDQVDLWTKNIAPFDYEFRNAQDDFLPLMRHLVEHYDTFIFATPVYWYSMSGTMKIFFDRISDLLKIDKETGRKLRGKNMAMISCSGSNDLMAGFDMPFVESAKYLGMNYLGDVHAWVEEGELVPEAAESLAVFAQELKEKLNLHK